MQADQNSGTCGSLRQGNARTSKLPGMGLDELVVRLKQSATLQSAAHFA
jgi:hypothetical protein